MRDTFFNYHPIVNMSYFIFVLGFSMFFLHPVCLIISLILAFWYSIYLNGKKTIALKLSWMLPLILITAVLNPVFNHEGKTVLMYFNSGNPLTLEATVYGIAAAFMLVTVINWFSCYNVVMTSDKFIYLFGRIIPALSLVLSMVLRFVPRFIRQFKNITNAQKCIGRDISTGSLLSKLKNIIHIFSAMITYALENAVETADSMKSRGYGLPGRSTFSIYKFDSRDAYALIFIILCSIYIIIGAGLGFLQFEYFPEIKGTAINTYTLSLFAVYLILCAMPLTINILEDVKWKSIQSKI